MTTMTIRDKARLKLAIQVAVGTKRYDNFLGDDLALLDLKRDLNLLYNWTLVEEEAEYILFDWLVKLQE